MTDKQSIINMARAILEADLVPKNMEITFIPNKEPDGSPGKLGTAYITLLYNFQKVKVFRSKGWSTFVPQKVKEQIYQNLVRIIRDNHLKITGYPEELSREDLVSGWSKHNPFENPEKFQKDLDN